MDIRIKCKRCNNAFSVKVLANNTIDTCPFCGREFSLRSSTILDNIMTVLYRNDKPLQDLEILRVCFNEGEYYVNSDFMHLYNAYSDANETAQKILSNIIDKLYLLCYHNVKDNNVPKLKEIENILQTQFNKKIEENNRYFDNLFGEDGESGNGQA